MRLGSVIRAGEMIGAREEREYQYYRQFYHAIPDDFDLAISEQGRIVKGAVISHRRITQGGYGAHGVS